MLTRQCRSQLLIVHPQQRLLLRSFSTGNDEDHTRRLLRRRMSIGLPADTTGIGGSSGNGGLGRWDDAPPTFSWSRIQDGGFGLIFASFFSLSFSRGGGVWLTIYALQCYPRHGRRAYITSSPTLEPLPPHFFPQSSSQFRLSSQRAPTSTRHPPRNRSPLLHQHQHAPCVTSRREFYLLRSH